MFAFHINDEMFDVNLFTVNQTILGISSELSVI